MSAEFAAALAAVQRYAQGQGYKADDHIDEDSFDALVYKWVVTDALAAVSQAAAVITAGATVALRLQVDASATVLRSDGADSWLSEERDPSEILPHLAESEPLAVWSTDDLLAGDAGAGFAAVAEGTVEVAFKKRGWRASVESEVARTVWIGPSTRGFANWIRDTVPEQIAEKLFSRPGGLVLLSDWSGPAAGDGERLAIGGLGYKPSDTADDDLLVKRLATRGECHLLPRWRLLDVESPPQPAVIHEPLRGAVGLTAARLLAAVWELGHVRPSATEPTEWTLALTPGGTNGDFLALVALVRWVGEDLGEARVEVARDLAARRLEDPVHNAARDPILQAAKLAYRLLVERDVRESLDHQQVLEEAFRDLDDRVAEMHATLADALDSGLTKAIAGALTITIASLTSAKVRDWPATIAGIVLAGYLAISAMNIWHLRGDSERRLDEAGTLARQRVEGLGGQLVSSLETWKLSLRRRAWFAFSVLIVVAVVVLIGGIAQNAKITGHDKGTTAPAQSKTAPSSVHRTNTRSPTSVP